MKKICWNDGWKVWKETDPFALIWNIPVEAAEITLPHDAMIEEKPYRESPNGGRTGFRDGGSYVYSKKFFAPQSWADKKIMVYFEGVYTNAMVYLNEQFLVENHHGYTGFLVDLCEYLMPDAENELRIIVRTDAMPNSRWYSGSGIYRDVYLFESNKTYFVPGEEMICTKSLDSEVAVIDIHMPVRNESDISRTFSACTDVFDKADNLVGKAGSKFNLQAGEQRAIHQIISISHPKLWDAGDPNLYTAKTQLKAEGEIVDEEEGKFGIRMVSADSEKGLRINGTTVRLRGACIHHDSGLLGAATYGDAVYRQIRLLKEAGFNAIRSAHHPAAPVLLEACDAMGMYVMDEFSDVWTRSKTKFDYAMFFGRDWEKDVTAMVKMAFNHPCVLFYSIGNEIPEIGRKQGTEMEHRIANRIRALDPTRLITAGINGTFSAGDRLMEIISDLEKKEFHGDVNDFMAEMNARMEKVITHPIVTERLEIAAADLDVLGYNYMTPRYGKDCKEHPDWVIVGSETYPPQIAENWEYIEKHANVVGDFTWTGWDHIGEAGVGIPSYKQGEGGFGAAFPAQLSYAGDIDITGFRRPASWYREIVFGLRRAPYLAVQDPRHYGQVLTKTPWVISDALHSWTFEGYDNRPVVVEVYGRGAEAELFLNGKRVARKKIITPGKNRIGWRTLFEVNYKPGVLEAVLYNENGELIGKDSMMTTKAPAKLCVEMEPEEGRGGNLRYGTLMFKDSYESVIDSYIYDEELRITGTDNVEILGFGSADPKALYKYRRKVAKTWNGRAQIIMRKKDQSRPGWCEIESKSGFMVKISLKKEEGG